MSEMVERVARSICRMYGGKLVMRTPDGQSLTNIRMTGYPWKPDGEDAAAYVDANWRSFAELAIAAIEAMREPTEFMVRSLPERPSWQAEAAMNYRLMIGYALSDPN